MILPVWWLLIRRHGCDARANQSRNHFGRDLEHRLELRFTNEHDVAAQVADGFLGPLAHPLNVVVRIPGCIPSRLPSWSFSSGHKTRAS